ncbi:16S rRNA (uracil(1498)-N(3))-methyltransferase [Candidatus Gracilibacteria bacterium]|nr:16S rRNA (uracil(1498)-N(3))-methyltransferase [Candidatus Gracilibacteria bacterium]
MQRIYLPNTKFLDVLEISEKQLYHQLTRVLRARVGQEVVFFDGIAREDHLYSMIHIDKNSVSFKRKEIISKNSELDTELALYQGFPNKLSKFETIVQKCSEVGYSKIVFFESERSQKLVLSDNKKERLKKISIEAIELCGGNIIPEIEYRGILGEVDGESLICHTQGDDSISLSETNIGNQINILVGPEGGFSPEEIQKISAQKIYFGERVLRCETVGEVVGFYISQF